MAEVTDNERAEFNTEEAARMSLSDAEAKVLSDAVNLMASVDDDRQVGHLGAMIFSTTRNPRKAMSLMVGLIKYTIDTHSEDGNKAHAADIIALEFKEFAEHIKTR